MSRPEKSRIGKLVPLFLGLMFIAMCSSEKSAPPLGGPTVSLPALELEAFGNLPPLQPMAIVPAFKDQAFPVERAINYQPVMAFLGVRLTPAQKRFLNEHRFLLIPKSATRYKGKVAIGGEADDAFDEMLGLLSPSGNGRKTLAFRRRL